MAEVVRKLLPDLRAVAPDADPLEWLEANWGRVSQAAFGSLSAELEQLRETAARAGLVQVLTVGVDLLSPLAQQDREVAHTRALGYFLDPRAPHGLRGEALRLFLQHLSRKVALDAQGQRVVEQIDRMLANVVDAAVIPELPYELEAGDRGRTDLWIEMPRDCPQFLLVIEMKIGMPATAHQLGRYEQAIHDRLRELKLPPESAIKALLSYEHFSPRKGWFAIRWRNVAAALAPASLLTTDGAVLLRFYLATLLQTMEGLTATPRTRLDEFRLRSFLRLSLENDL